MPTLLLSNAMVQLNCGNKRPFGVMPLTMVFYYFILRLRSCSKNSAVFSTCLKYIFFTNFSFLTSTLKKLELLEEKNLEEIDFLPD